MLLRPVEHGANLIRLPLPGEDAGVVRLSQIVVDGKIPAPALQIGAQDGIFIACIELLQPLKAVFRIGEAEQTQDLIDVQKDEGEGGVAERAPAQPGPPAKIALQNVLWQIPVGRIVGPEDAAVNRVALPVGILQGVLGEQPRFLRQRVPLLPLEGAGRRNARRLCGLRLGQRRRPRRDRTVCKVGRLACLKPFDSHR